MLSSAALQIIALVSMTIDHIGYYFLPDCTPLRIIGRLAFPLFVFMLVEGYKHTRSLPKYFLRIIIAAVAAQIVIYALAVTRGFSYTHNTLFTLAFALAALYFTERGKWYLVFAPIIALIPSALNCDYGAFGVFMAVAFYYADRLFADNRALRVISQAIVLFAVMPSCAAYSDWWVLNWAVLAIIPIALYSGKKGRRLPKFFGYVYYPAHLLVVLIVQLLFF